MTGQEGFDTISEAGDTPEIDVESSLPVHAGLKHGFRNSFLLFYEDRDI